MTKLTLAGAAISVAIAAFSALPSYAQTDTAITDPAVAPSAAAATDVGVDASATEAPTTAPSGSVSVDKTPVGVLLDTPAYRTVFERHFPEAVANPKLSKGRKMTLRQMQIFAPKEFTNERLSAMDAELKTATAS